MPLGYRAALALTSLLALGAVASPAPKHATARRPRHFSVTAPAASIYSRHALRQARIILQLKMLEMREARLERIRRVVEGKLPPDSLFSLPP